MENFKEGDWVVRLKEPPDYVWDEWFPPGKPFKIRSIEKDVVLISEEGLVIGARRCTIAYKYLFDKFYEEI